MTDQELLAYTQAWSLAAFQRPFRHQIYFNRRLKTTGGRYHLSDHHIDINPLMLEEFDLANLKRVVLHELCHYHLHLTGRGYQHRDQDFKQLLAAVGGARYTPRTSQRRRVQAQQRYCYQCQACGIRYWRKRRVNLARYRCGRCRGRLILKKIEKTSR